MEQKIQAFQTAVWRHYRTTGRHDLPWRSPEPDGSFDPYKILVSEIMLQQTQVARVVPKYQLFLERFPSFAALSAAPLGDVLRVWSGLGYNRRAKYLWLCAGRVVAEYGGKLPQTSAELIKLPGIGANTAGAVLAYAFHQPVLFVETNIRTVFIHHFLADQQAVDDRQILDLVARTLPEEPRTWYWALMDYGSHLKQIVGNLNTLSKHYAKQSRFEGSARQVRGQILRLLAAEPKTLQELKKAVTDERLPQILRTLLAEGMVAKSATSYKLQD
jgi:A/G-specific adenine glycosylase